MNKLIDLTVLKASVVVAVLTLAGCMTVESQSVFTSEINEQKQLDSYIQIAVLHLESKAVEPALLAVKKAMEVDDESPRVYEVLALTLEQAGDYDRAEDAFAKMLKYGKDYTQGKASFSGYLLRRERYQEAYDMLQIVVDDIYYPRRAFAYINLAAAAKKLGKDEEVRIAYQKAVALDSRFVPVLLELAEIRFNNKEYPEALELLTEYRSKIRQSSPKALLLGIKLATVMGDRNAKASYALALKNLYPDSPEYQEYLDYYRK